MAHFRKKRNHREAKVFLGLFMCGVGTAGILASTAETPGPEVTKDIVTAYTLKIDVSQSGSAYHPFWESTGYSPLMLSLRPDMRQTLDWIGAIADQGIVYVRPHYALDLVSVEGMETGKPTYDWSKLDAALDAHVENGLKFIFEIMGYPADHHGEAGGKYDSSFQERLSGGSSYFENMSDPAVIRGWKQLVEALATHLIGRYGEEEVRDWYFESWNEPNLATFWKHTVEDFFNYYDACSEGLKAVDPELRFGGPGTAGGFGFPEKINEQGHMGNAFFEHIVNGTNFFTGEKGSRLDFASVHIKKMPERMIANEKKEFAKVTRFPSLQDIPLFNDEADPWFGWKREMWPRATPWYGAFVARSVQLRLKPSYLEALPHYVNFSSDNAFMGGFYHRTLLARFQREAGGGFANVKKPVYQMMSLLGGLHGGRAVPVEVPDTVKAHLGAFAVRLEKEVALFVVNFPNTAEALGDPTKTVTPEERALMDKQAVDLVLQLENLGLSEAMQIHYRLDEGHGNPYAVWRAQGSPGHPTNAQLADMRAVQEPTLYESPQTVSGTDPITISLGLPSPGVSVIKFVEKPAEAPGQPENLRYRLDPALNGGKELMLRWDFEGSRSIKSFEVLYGEEPDGTYQQLNKTAFIDNGFSWLLPEGLKNGYLKVRAVDYWDRPGPFSEVLSIEVR